MKKLSDKKVLKERLNSIIDFISPIMAIVFFGWVIVWGIAGIIDTAPKIMRYISETNTSSDNLPTCPESEKIIIGYRDGNPMKICEQTYTFIVQDLNYSCILTDNRRSGTLVFARVAGEKGINEKDFIAGANQLDTNMEKMYPDLTQAMTQSTCDLGRISPEQIQRWYSGNGDGSTLTHSKTLGF